MSEKMFGQIYVITNLLNQKKYVGLTIKTLEERFEAHLYRANREKSVIQKAIKKYGKENFTIERLDIATTEEELFEKEKQWIAKLDTYLGYGYNQTDGGGGIVNMSEEIRTKISKTKTGVPNPKLKGREISEKQRLQISRTLGAKRVRGVHRYWGYEVFYDYPTQAKKDGFNPSLVCAVIKGKRNHHKGYIFEYVDDANPDRPVESKESTEVQRIESDPTKSRL